MFLCEALDYAVKNEMDALVLEDDYAEGSPPDLLDHGFAFVGAVHSLVEAEHASGKYDLILAEASHALVGGDKTEAEIRAVIHRVWPGARVSEKDVAESLRVGKEIGRSCRGNRIDRVAVCTDQRRQSNFRRILTT